MDLTPYLDQLRDSLLRGSEDEASTRRLLDQLEPSFRLTVMQLLSDAAAGLSHDLPPDTEIQVRLVGRDPYLHVDIGQPIAPPPPPEPEEDRSATRITLRLPDGVKRRADEAAEAEGISLNAWITNAVRHATEPGRNRGSRHRRGMLGNQMTGWV